MKKVKLGLATDIEYVVYDDQGVVVQEGVAENLITQHGRDMLASLPTGDWLGRLALGTGTSVLEVSAGMASQTGSVVTASQDFPADVASRRMCIFFDDGTAARVVTRVDARNVTVDRSATVALQPLTLVFDDVIKLNAYHGQTAVATAGSTTFVDSIDRNSCTHSRWRTFSYAPPAGVTITELGVTNSSAVNPDMHTVANLTNPIIIPAGGTLSLKYTLLIGIDTSVSNAGDVIDGIPADVHCRVNGLNLQASLWQFTSTAAVTGISGGASRQTVGAYHGWLLEPYTFPGQSYNVFFSEEDYDVQQIPVNASLANNLAGSPAPPTMVVGSNAQPYSIGSFKSRISATTFGIGSSSWRVFGLCGEYIGTAIQARCKFATPQLFGTSDFLTVVFEKSWEV